MKNYLDLNDGRAMCVLEGRRVVTMFTTARLLWEWCHYGKIK